MHVVVWDRSDASGGSAARVRVTLDPRQRHRQRRQQVA
jgi:hypothetical protein